MRLSSVTLAGALAFSASSASAGGYDTPILYSAEHMGLGGAAIGYVDDPSAMFHNPAGLMGTKGLTLMANLTLITGEIVSSPASSNPNEASDPILALAPLVGVSYDLDDVVAFGLAFYPVASAGAEYNYNEGGPTGSLVRNFTSVRFLEFSPNVAVKIPGTNLSIGAGYRVSLVQLGRELGAEGADPTFDVDMSGVNFEGFRVGIQWQPIHELEIGFVFRNKTTTEVTDDLGRILIESTDIKTEFTLPAKLGFGLRLNLDPIAVVADVEYGFYSQNKRNVFNGTPVDPEDDPIPVLNISNWEDAITFRAGVEYGIDNRWFFRGGFLYDGKVSQVDYPSAFGTPPDSTTTITAGFGTKCEDNWELNFAIAHRIGSAKVKKSDDAEFCLPCSVDGDYKLSMTGFYVDFTYAFPNL
ncbi:MAG TPA: outer membrane protein transport protein [Myxococcota bacterium]|nr:outer membrane protein transport protein [Myxococcota bacterium]